MADVLTPDADQLKVIDFDPRGRMVVTAGPGSGKTFTAALRAAKIVDAVDGDLPVLALSFSRAAAHAIRSSCWRSGCRAGIRFSTLDSWAGSHVASVDRSRGDDRLSTGFDDVIVHAIELVRSLGDEVRLCSHLIVDEAQDVSGPRRELVLELMRRTTMGWTVLGDLAQKIFDFDDDSGSLSVGGAAQIGMRVGTNQTMSDGRFDLPKHLNHALECVPSGHRDAVIAALRASLRAVSPSTESGAPESTDPRGVAVQPADNAVIDGSSILEWAMDQSTAGTGVSHLRLTVDHRATTESLRSVRRLGDLLRAERATEGTVDSLWGAYLDTKNHVAVNLRPGANARDELSGKLLVWGRKPASTAVLVRRKSDLLVLSRHLASLGDPVPHDIIHTKDQEIVPAWVAGLSGAGSEEELRDLIPDALDPTVVVAMLRTEYLIAGKLNEEAVAGAINAGRVPEYLKTPVQRGVMLSTIHRVKGLEFDRVILGNWPRPGDADGMLPESRLMFVGLTRASSENWGMNLEHGVTIKPVRPGASRLAEHRHSGKRTTPVGVEVRSTDIRITRPIPESIELVLRLESGNRGAPIRYSLGSADGGQEFGFTLDDFGDAMSAVTGGKHEAIPPRLFGLLRTGTCTIAPEAHLRHHWSGRKLVVAPVLAGIVTWKEG